ncbi:MAG: ATP synthase F1 subunit gamma [Bacteroidales bacterium]|nr:ATP synthase F1 subunit gamma [Bacteroidales bacterium]
MANLKDIRIRINSVKTTRQVTSAMKMVSAAKLKKAQDNVDHVRPFVAKLVEISNFLGASVDNIEETFGYATPKKGKTLVLAIASNKGLAGAFNSTVVKEVDRMLKEEWAAEYQAGNLEIVAVGKQLVKGLAARHIAIAAERNAVLDDLTKENVYKLADEFMADYGRAKYQKVILVYNTFVNAAVQTLTTQQLLPLSIAETTEGGAYLDFIVEPNKAEVLADLVPQVVQAKLLAAFMESAASEHGSRMTSMNKATDNATELLGDLQLQYNKARQSAITNELIEIVSGAEALNS